MSERWLGVPGYEGRYAVSDQGRVKSLDCVLYRPHANGSMVAVRKKGVLLRPATTPSGHQQVMLGRGGANKWLVHQLVMLAFVGPCPEGMEILHIDSNPANNRPRNLKYGTRSENMKMDYAAGVRKTPRAFIYSLNGKRREGVNYEC